MFFKTYTTWSFKVVVFQRMVKKCTKIYNGCFSWHHCCSLPSKLPVYTVYITVKNGFYIRGDQKNRRDQSVAKWKQLLMKQSVAVIQTIPIVTKLLWFIARPQELTNV